MKKNVFTYALFALLLICVMVSCNNGSSPSPAEPDRPAELKVTGFKDNYPVGATKADLVGSLIYTDTKGKITSVDIKDDGVTTDFDAESVAENKILKITYKGIDTTATYNVVKIEDVDLSGCFVFDDDLTIDFFSGTKEAAITKYDNWGQFMNYTIDPSQVEDVQYEVALSPAGFTVARLTYQDKRYSFYPDGEGGVKSYPADFDLPQPEMEKLYLSTEAKKIPGLDSSKKYYLYALFTYDGIMKMWFRELNNVDPSGAAADVTIGAALIKFGIGGVEIRQGTDGGEKAKNLRMYMRDDKINIVSGTDTDYKGYSFSLKVKN